MNNKVDIIVNQQPVDISFECPFCESDIEIDYSEFCGLVDEPCDWNDSKFECPHCKNELIIDSVDWC